MTYFPTHLNSHLTLWRSIVFCLQCIGRTNHTIRNVTLCIELWFPNGEGCGPTTDSCFFTLKPSDITDQHKENAPSLAVNTPDYHLLCSHLGSQQHYADFVLGASQDSHMQLTWTNLLASCLDSGSSC